MEPQTRVLVRPARQITVAGTYYGPGDIAGFAPAIATKLVREGRASYVDEEGRPSATPVAVTVAPRSSHII